MMIKNHSSKMLTRYQIFFLLSIASCGGAFAASKEIDMTLGCKSNPQLVAACFSVNGRLSVFNGSPSLRILPTGTHRSLGIVEDQASLSIPQNIRTLVGFDKDIYGNFLVCPLTKKKPAQMQLVCVDEARNVHVQNRR